ncbi:MAG: glycosyltransferase family 2 protein [Alphaproteobacteria bacterium]
MEPQKEQVPEARRPLVSIGLLTRNNAAFMRGALDALVAQDYPRLEIIVLDNASSDDSHAIARDYAARHPFLRALRNETDLGVSGSFARLEALTAGEYFLWACPDDRWTPDFVSNLVAALESTPGAVAAMCPTRKTFADGRSEVMRLEGADVPGRQPLLRLVRAMAKERNGQGERVRYNAYIHGVMRRECVWEVIPDDLAYLANEIVIVIFLALIGQLVFVDRVMFEKHIDSASFTERYPDDPLGAVRNRLGTSLKGLAVFVLRVLRSRDVRLADKPKVFAVLFPLAVRHAKSALYPMLVRRLSPDALRTLKLIYGGRIEEGERGE